MKKVISLALFGSGDKYAQYLHAYVLAHLNLFPIEEGWELRVHISDSLDQKYGRFLQRLAVAGLVEVYPMGPAVLTKAMLWRMLPVFDESVDYVFCRDIDAAPMPRDRACMETFIITKAVVHTIHDHEQHAGIMGGLCGFRSKEFRQLLNFKTLDDLYKTAGSTDAAYAVHGEDQNVLNRMLLKPGGPPLLEHRYAGWFKGPGKFERRGPGVFACPAWSTPVPDKGKDWNGPFPELSAFADGLAPHLGSAGYDHPAAIMFWEQYGNKSITRRVAECAK